MISTSHLNTTPPGNATVSDIDAPSGRAGTLGDWGASLNNLQMQVAHANRVATLGAMSASIVHEVNQPLAAIAASAAASLGWLTRANPDLAEAVGAIRTILGNVRRANEMIERIRALATNSEPEMLKLDINNVIDEVVAFTK